VCKPVLLLRLPVPLPLPLPVAVVQVYNDFGSGVHGIFTRDYRMSAQTCRVLLTVPACLEILMLSPTNRCGPIDMQPATACSPRGLIELQPGGSIDWQTALQQLLGGNQGFRQSLSAAAPGVFFKHFPGPASACGPCPVSHGTLPSTPPSGTHTAWSVCLGMLAGFPPLQHAVC